jgi:DNA-binding TFAR19-related protein (PDSD5 family)
MFYPFAGAASQKTMSRSAQLPPVMKAVLSKLARQRTTDAITLARIWLAERLERELKAG